MKCRQESGLSLPHLLGIIPLSLDHDINSCYLISNNIFGRLSAQHQSKGRCSFSFRKLLFSHSMMPEMIIIAAVPELFNNQDNFESRKLLSDFPIYFLTNLVGALLFKCFNNNIFEMKGIMYRK